MKQFSPSCDRNKEPILAILKEILPVSGLVVEIGSGTGQHAAYFAANLPQLAWQPTDLPANFPSIRAWASDAGLSNVRDPLALDLLADRWPVLPVSAVVCINTIHIVAWAGVENLFAGARRVLASGDVLYAYGPYRYRDRPLEPSNEEFDRWLKARDPVSGVRDFEAVNALAEKHGLALAGETANGPSLARGPRLDPIGDRAMRANNRSLWWRK